MLWYVLLSNFDAPPDPRPTPSPPTPTQNELVLGKHSGRHAFRARLTELGYDLNDAELNKAFVRFKVLGCGSGGWEWNR